MMISFIIMKKMIPLKLHRCFLLRHMFSSTLHTITCYSLFHLSFFLQIDHHCVQLTKTLTVYPYNMMNHHSSSPAIRFPGNPYIQNSPAPPPTTAANTFTTLGRKIDTATTKAENLVENIGSHYRTGPGILDVTKSRLNQTARFLFEGGSEQSFKRDFGYVYGEQLMKTYACYLSITGGPFLGTIYISNRRVCFKSDNPVWTGPDYGPGRWVYYKLVVEMERVQAVNPSQDRRGDKYIVIVTKDGHEFWFMGFVFFEKALKHLFEALPSAPLHFMK